VDLCLEETRKVCSITKGMSRWGKKDGNTEAFHDKGGGARA